MGDSTQNMTLTNHMYQENKVEEDLLDEHMNSAEENNIAWHIKSATELLL